MKLPENRRGPSRRSLLVGLMGTMASRAATSASAPLGMAYSPTDAGVHFNEYIITNRRDELYVKLLPPNELRALGLRGTGLNHGAWLRDHCFTFVRLYAVPLERHDEIDAFLTAMRRVHEIYGIKAYVSDFLGLYEGAHALDASWLHYRMARFVDLYAGEHWLSGISLGNENDRFIRGGSGGRVLLDLDSSDYYDRMDEIAAYTRREATRKAVNLQIFLGHSHPNTMQIERFRRLVAFDGLGINLYTDTAGVHQVLGELSAMNRVREEKGVSALKLMIAEFGQSPNAVVSMTNSERAADFRDQLRAHDSHPLAGRVVFEMTDEQWKLQEEGAGSTRLGIYGKPELSDAFRCTSGE